MMENKELDEQTAAEEQTNQQENVAINEENATADAVVEPVNTEVKSEENVVVEKRDVKQEIEDVTILDEGEAAIVDEEVAEAEIVDEEAAEAAIVNEEAAEAAIVDEEVAEAEIVDEEVVEAAIVDEEVAEAEIVDEEVVEAENEDIIADDHAHLTREELVEELDKLVNSGDLNEMKLHIPAIRASFNSANKEFKQELEATFLATATEDEKFVYEADEIEKRFEGLNDVYKYKRQEYLAEQENIKQVNLAKKKEILDKLKSIVDNEDVNKKIYDEFRDLQEAWRQIGVIPKEESNELWQSYHFVVERFFDKVKINNELRELDFKKNLEAKISICEKAEELFLDDNLNEVSKKLQDLHAKWKELGMVASDKKDEIWERFKNISEKLNARRQEYFDTKNKELQANYEAKLALIGKAKELLNKDINSIKGWQDKTMEHAELFKLWKSIGRAPKEYHDTIWNEFKAITNAFYANKSEYFNKIKSEQDDNYNIKVDLCVKAEALKDSVDWSNTSKELIKLQKEWKNVGPVSQRLSEKIWKRFRAACDEFFDAKTEFFSHINENEGKNLELKKELIEKVANYEYTGEKSANLQVLKDFQKQWFDIGHVPIKEKDNVYKAFRQTIDQQMEKLGISSIDMTDSNFRSRVDSIKESGGGDRAISKEINSINEKINAMQEEISLWENNIEFFSKSKNSDVLRAEFERKIDKAKKDLKVQQLKLNYLRNH